MSISLYEQFMAIGSVKSLLTGKEISVPQAEETNTKNATASSQTPVPEK
ncbi:MAG: hypothetical protein IKR09_09445 [Alphaproteobacteria bacterium]|nr:hypothetical protein [Alphaproteobacteria bacterium]